VQANHRTYGRTRPALEHIPPGLTARPKGVTHTHPACSTPITQPHIRLLTIISGEGLWYCRDLFPVSPANPVSGLHLGYSSPTSRQFRYPHRFSPARYFRWLLLCVDQRGRSKYNPAYYNRDVESWRANDRHKTKRVPRARRHAGIPAKRSRSDLVSGLECA